MLASHHQVGAPVQASVGATQGEVAASVGSLARGRLGRVSRWRSGALSPSSWRSNIHHYPTCRRPHLRLRRCSYLAVAGQRALRRLPCSSGFLGLPPAPQMLRGAPPPPPRCRCSFPAGQMQAARYVEGGIWNMALKHAAKSAFRHWNEDSGAVPVWFLLRGGENVRSAPSANELAQALRCGASLTRTLPCWICLDGSPFFDVAMLRPTAPRLRCSPKYVSRGDLPFNLVRRRECRWYTERGRCSALNSELGAFANRNIRATS